MRTQVLACCLILSVLPLACGNREAKLWPAPDPDERLALSLPRRDYLLGEPIPFDLSFRNLGKGIIKVVECIVEPGHYEARVWIAPDGEPFQPFFPNVTDWKVSRRVFSVGPGDDLKYQYRVIGAPWPKFRFAFAKPGKYRVYVLYPLWVWGAQQTVNIASNVVQVTIKPPLGEDAQVWRKLNDPSFLTILQIERVYKDNSGDALKMAELLRDYPDSGYTPALRHALAKIYFNHRLYLAEKDQLRLAQTLGITYVDAIDDARLEARRKDQLKKGTSLIEKETPLAKVLDLMSEIGVPFDSAPELKDRKVNIGRAYYKLRLGMRQLSDELEASWERRGDGYFLVPFQAAPEKRPEKKRKRGHS